MAFHFFSMSRQRGMMTKALGRIESAPHATTLEELVTRSKTLSRGEKNRLWSRALAECTRSDDVHRLAVLVAAEGAHIRCVRLAHEAVTRRPSEHDHTKDVWYTVVVCLAYVMRGKRHLVDDVLDDVIEAHVTSEPHHEQYHELRGTVPSDDNVTEMALDRLARNVQKNHGRYNWPQMALHAPKWPPHCESDECERLTESYNRYVHDYSGFVQRLWCAYLSMLRQFEATGW